MSACHPGVPGTQNLCSAHCYSGSRDDRLAHLEREVEGLRRTISEQREHLRYLRWIQSCVDRGDFDGAKRERQSWQSSKLDRQRGMLMRLQAKRAARWEPETIIYEPDYTHPLDEYEIAEDVSDLPHLIHELTE